MTTFSAKSVSEVQDMLGMADNKELKWKELRGYNFYSDRVAYEGVNILYGGRYDNMGMQIDLSGTGCRTFETYGHGSYEKLYDLQTYGCNITRLDIAFDDKIGIIPISKLMKDTIKGNFTSEYKSVMYTGGTDGDSVQHGRKVSPTMIRIYDKAKERNREEEGHWIRVEIQLRHEPAKNAFKYLMSDEYDISTVFLGALVGKLRYVKEPRKSTDENKSRWESADYWEKLIKNAERIKLYEKVGQEYNLAKLKRQIINNAGPITAYIDIFDLETLNNDVGIKVAINGRNEKYDRLVEELRNQERELKGGYYEDRRNIN
jgi:phage replication initiation protein